MFLAGPQRKAAASHTKRVHPMESLGIGSYRRVVNSRKRSGGPTTRLSDSQLMDGNRVAQKRNFHPSPSKKGRSDCGLEGPAEDAQAQLTHRAVWYVVIGGEDAQGVKAVIKSMGEGERLSVPTVRETESALRLCGTTGHPIQEAR
ncbi:hypothetical protein, unlikely [Trypanosoma brucei brucei TREU927]|uniref:Uncharacterized protein n=1 Tax=Trypanosoma brucei brucei (strain 927/4 GUTat10.1) TaxID=185431 RepID=Q38EQ9_TRYB2|nr:hypothetical protein, unlikely [Trypanosoma brucei brucei TREU927]EAN76711.1 hypothetical protein, unlikely [Trypanosoma brucei brucei TREU927]